MQDFNMETTSSFNFDKRCLWKSNGKSMVSSSSASFYGSLVAPWGSYSNCIGRRKRTRKIPRISPVPSDATICVKIIDITERTSKHPLLIWERWSSLTVSTTWVGWKSKQAVLVCFKHGHWNQFWKQFWNAFTILTCSHYRSIHPHLWSKQEKTLPGVSSSLCETDPHLMFASNLLCHFESTSWAIHKALSESTPVRASPVKHSAITGKIESRAKKRTIWAMVVDSRWRKRKCQNQIQFSIGKRKMNN